MKRGVSFHQLSKLSQDSVTKLPSLLRQSSQFPEVIDRKAAPIPEWRTLYQQGHYTQRDLQSTKNGVINILVGRAGCTKKEEPNILNTYTISGLYH